MGDYLSRALRATLANPALESMGSGCSNGAALSELFEAN